ncbi:MAG TPA: response regulator transcription factor [Oscillospiraceae bacterium]|nr:response regulator transcription factor [Oscillospiraceae bacterium]
MKILVVDDHPLVRRGIVSTLSFDDDISNIFEASSINESLKIIEDEKPDLAIIDLYLANEDGLKIISKCKGEEIDTKFVILTSSLKKDDFQRCMEIGVDGYILKEAFAEDIIYAIGVVLRGRQFIDPEIIRYRTTVVSENEILDELTPREHDVLQELGKGLSNYEIAKNLYIAENTVKKHVSSILSKLDLTHRTQAALLANTRLGCKYSINRV